MFDNNRQGSNAPILTGPSLTEQAALSGGGTFDHCWGKAATKFTYQGVYHLIMSNTGTANIWVGNSATVKGVLLQPGASMNLSVAQESNVYIVRDAAGASTCNAILFR
jgi:hypothetical protein